MKIRGCVACGKSVPKLQIFLKLTPIVSVSYGLLFQVLIIEIKLIYAIYFIS